MMYKESYQQDVKQAGLHILLNLAQIAGVSFKGNTRDRTSFTGYYYMSPTYKEILGDTTSIESTEQLQTLINITEQGIQWITQHTSIYHPFYVNIEQQYQACQHAFQLPNIYPFTTNGVQPKQVNVLHDILQTLPNQDYIIMSSTHSHLKEATVIVRLLLPYTKTYQDLSIHLVELEGVELYSIHIGTQKHTKSIHIKVEDYELHKQKMIQTIYDMIQPPVTATNV